MGRDVWQQVYIASIVVNQRNARTYVSFFQSLIGFKPAGGTKDAWEILQESRINLVTGRD